MIERRGRPADTADGWVYFQLGVVSTWKSDPIVVLLDQGRHGESAVRFSFQLGETCVAAPIIDHVVIEYVHPARHIADARNHHLPVADADIIAAHDGEIDAARFND